LAFGPAEERDRYLMRLKEISANDTQQVPSRRKLAEILNHVRAQGFAEDDGEYSVDIGCFAGPIVDRAGIAVAAVSVSGPRTRIRQRRDELVPLVQVAAKELTDLLNSVSDIQM
jgi:IclR family acetate operon transcriptional repressor